MIECRLLIDLEAVVELDSLPKRHRARLLPFFEKLRAYPDHYASASERDDVGRLINIAAHAGWLIYYWTDFADRHVKILNLQRATSAQFNKRG